MMSHRTRALALTALLATALAGCSSGGKDSAYGDILDRALAGGPILGNGASGGDDIELSDAQINALPMNVLIVESETLGSRTGFVQAAVNRDTVTWQSDDRKQIVTRGGQLVGTIGFGNDLTSATAPTFNAPQASRARYILGGDERVERVDYACTLGDGGTENVTVTGRVFATRVLTERCTSPTGPTFENRYWIDGSGAIRKSRQFATPGLGYLTIGDVHTGRR
ncbi:hypothetical protein E2L08_03905 [Palleronia sediminis]|uniref:Group 4 capsule polysaccharide lipoprotein gfcB, YjbF n=1 Tax=Palleronia sediminis TaxID=2547833 RepID=A0A4R6AH76_9RHOB|nr:YjbF family lipoprotein [Palleronia sediminis]TDL81808.1 hypothetical protein E2L08_03905 [Palleronia sediminis]